MERAQGETYWTTHRAYFMLLSSYVRKKPRILGGPTISCLETLSSLNRKTENQLLQIIRLVGGNQILDNLNLLLTLNRYQGPCSVTLERDRDDDSNRDSNRE